MSREASEASPAGVPEAATQVGEIYGRWPWVEPSIWTGPMLRALETGVKGGKWYSLFDKVFAESTLRASWRQVRRKRGSAGTDHVSVEEYSRGLRHRLSALSESLRDGHYRPQSIRRVSIPKPGGQEDRPLGIPTVRDRVVQGALRLVLEPIFERDFAAHSYGFRPRRGAKDALRRVQNLLNQGRPWVLDADLRRYFDTIPHAGLMRRIEEKVSDGRVLSLIAAFLRQHGVASEGSGLPEEGTPQGAVLSPLLANLYLDPLDHLLARQGYEMVRYADDFVVLCASEEEAQRALAEITAWVAQAGLTLHPDKTRIVDATQRGGSDFLGYHFERGYRWPSAKSLRQHLAALRAQTLRTDGRSLREIVQRVNEIRRGWWEYFQHSHWTTFRRLDQRLRARLRSLLRKRQKRRGRARGRDHQRWPNAYFAELGLFSYTQAHARALRPQTR